MPKSSLKTRDDDEQEEKAVPTNVSGQRLKSFLERVERLNNSRRRRQTV